MAGEKLLMIDDEADIRTVARLSLEKVGGFQVLLASGGEEGLEKAAREGPDLILLDAMMPGLDGPSTLKRLREIPECAEIPVVFLTAKAQRADVERFEALGALGVLTKPFDPMKLPQHVREYLPD